VGGEGKNQNHCKLRFLRAQSQHIPFDYGQQHNILWISCGKVCTKSGGDISHSRNRGFYKVSVGDTQQQIIQSMGNPSVFEKNGGTPFLRYTDHACKSPAPNGFGLKIALSLDIEAWSVDLDDSGKVIRKAHWMSP
jgi:hypothetical protein